MILQHLILVLLLLLSLVTRSVVSAGWHRSGGCKVSRSGNDLSAGEPSLQTAECKYNEADDTFYQQIVWKPPLGAPLKVSGYMVKILYGKNWVVCFHFNASIDSFRFDASKGFRRGRDLRFAVIPQPVQRIVRSRLHRGIQCPPRIKLKAIPNKYVVPGYNTTFKCVFETGKIRVDGEHYYKPVLNFTVNWYFSKDFNCHSGRRILIQNSENFRLSDDSCTLRVINAKPEQEGCYLLHVDHASGTYYYGASARYRERYDTLQVRSYLYMNNTKFAKLVHMPSDGDLGIKAQFFVALLVGVCLFVLILFAIMIRLYFRKHYFKVLAPTPEPMMKVYISHAFNDPDDVHTLLKFASLLQSFNVDIILDVCSEVQINIRSGLSRWVPGSIRSADKIVVVLTKEYADIMQHDTPVTDADGMVYKVHAEYNYISNIMHNSLHKSNRILLVSNGVKPSRFPPLFENKIFYDFPKNMTSAWGTRSGLDSRGKQIVEALLEKKLVG